jgi:hypothetical protein
VPRSVPSRERDRGHEVVCDSQSERPAPSGSTDVRTVLASSPEQIRTAVSALRGRRPRPLDDGADGLGGEDSNPQ